METSFPICWLKIMVTQTSFCKQTFPKPSTEDFWPASSEKQRMWKPICTWILVEIPRLTRCRKTTVQFTKIIEICSRHPKTWKKHDLVKTNGFFSIKIMNGNYPISPYVGRKIKNQKKINKKSNQKIKRKKNQIESSKKNQKIIKK